MRLLPLLLVFSATVSAQPVLTIRDVNDAPQTFAIVVGISNYKYVRPLTFAHKDAELFRDFLRSPAGGRVSDNNIFFLQNEQASTSNFWIKGFHWLRTKTLKKGDRLFIYLAGHGDAIDENQFFFLGYDCNPRGDKNNYLVSGAIQLYNLKMKIASETAKGVEVVFIMDACRSSELPGGFKGQQILNTAISEKKSGEIIMLATSAGQSSLEDASIGSGNGLFTYYLINGLLGIADSTGTIDNKVSLSEIEKYVNNYVPEVAKSQFKRTQQPFFCCADMRDHIISEVDTAFLRTWLKERGRRGGGNRFHSNELPHSIDTTVLDTYNQFSDAIRTNQLTGNNSAEEIYRQMELTYPGNPYTLDARSTLAAALVDYAQKRVELFLDCGEPGLDFDEAGNRLEKAINLLKTDEPQFSATYLSRMYFLKSSSSFANAHAALALDPNAAFINNQLALLHKKNNNQDSALYYARKTVSLAPNWRCGYNTLSTIEQNTAGTSGKNKNDNSFKSKKDWGLMAGGGLTEPVLKLSNWEQRNINYNDSLTGIRSNGGSSLGLGAFFQFNISPRFSIRPTVFIAFENFDIVYSRISATGLPFSDRLVFKTSSASTSAQFLLRLLDKKINPYLSAAPSFSALVQDATTKTILPLKKTSVGGKIAIGVDVNFPGGFVFTPELAYLRSLSNELKNIDNLHTNTLSRINRETFGINFLVRKVRPL